MGGHSLAPYEEAHAYSTGTSLIISARGTVPESCWGVAVKSNFLTIHPPQFVLELYRKEDFCLPVLTPYSTSAEFEMGTVPDTITLYFDDNGQAGQAEIQVEPIPTALAPPEATADANEATGVSFAFNFEEALDNALAALGGEAGNVPVKATVERIDAETGGFVGRYIAVTVRRS